MFNSSFVVARVMHFFIHTNQCFNCLIKITKTQYLFDQIAHISAYDKARTSHESSLKGSDSTFSDGLNSFQNCSMMAPVTVQSSSCPPCHSFSRIFQNLIYCVGHAKPFCVFKSASQHNMPTLTICLKKFVH